MISFLTLATTTRAARFRGFSKAHAQMKKMFFAALFLAAGLQAARAADSASSAAGHWEGKLQMDPSHELDMALDLAVGPKGGWIGTIGFLKSTTRDVPLDSVTIKGDTVEFTAHVPGPASFSAQLSADQASLEGTAANEKGEAPFQLKRNGDAKVNLPPPSSPLAKEFAGTWEGTLNVPNAPAPITVTVTLSAASDGLALGVIAVEQPKHMEFPINVVTIQEKDLRFEVRSISGAFAGKLGANGEVSGEWAQGPAKLPLSFKRATAPAAK